MPGAIVAKVIPSTINWFTNSGVAGGVGGGDRIKDGDDGSSGGSLSGAGGWVVKAYVVLQALSPSALIVLALQ